jgi:hypothetical protein
MSLATDYLLLNIGHSTLKWHLSRIKSGSFTVDQVAAFYQPDPKQPTYNTVKKGLQELLKMKPDELPIMLR